MRNRLRAPASPGLIDRDDVRIIGRGPRLLYLGPSRSRVAAPRKVGAKIFRVNMPPGPVREEQLDRHAACLDEQDGLVAVSGERGLNALVERRRALTLPPGLVRLPAGREGPPLWLAPANLVRPAAHPGRPALAEARTGLPSWFIGARGRL
jgi:hypothetical protein